VLDTDLIKVIDQRQGTLQTVRLSDTWSAYCRVSDKFPNTWPLYLSSHLHFTDRADLCGYPRSRHRARCIVTFCVASAILFVVLTKRRHR